MLHGIDKKLDTHISDTTIYRQNQSSKTDEHHKTLYGEEHGLVYAIRSLKAISNQNEKHKKLMITLFGVPIAGWLIQSFINLFNK